MWMEQFAKWYSTLIVCSSYNHVTLLFGLQFYAFTNSSAKSDHLPIYRCRHRAHTRPIRIPAATILWICTECHYYKKYSWRTAWFTVIRFIYICIYFFFTRKKEENELLLWILHINPHMTVELRTTRTTRTRRNWEKERLRWQKTSMWVFFRSRVNVFCVCVSPFCPPVCSSTIRIKWYIIRFWHYFLFISNFFPVHILLHHQGRI